MKQCFIGLGSNINNPVLQLNIAIEKIQQISHTKLIKKSCFYRTEPFGFKEQPDFINAVVEINTKLNPFELLTEVQKIEAQMGRMRTKKWGERIIDLDILLYGEETINLLHLQIPHPGLTERLFVLMPLYEIAPYLMLPNGSCIKDILSQFSLTERKKIIQLPIIKDETIGVFE